MLRVPIEQDQHLLSNVKYALPFCDGKRTYCFGGAITVDDTEECCAVFCHLGFTASREIGRNKLLPTQPPVQRLTIG